MYPLVELHCHLDGAIPSNLFLKYCKEANLVDTDDETWLKNHIMTEAMSLPEALAQFALLTSLLQTKEHLSETTLGLINQKYDEGVRILEIRFAPQLHNSLTMDEAVEAVIDGLNKGKEAHPDMVCGILLCMMNNDEMELNMETVRLCAKYKGQGVVGLDLAGNEGYNKKEAFDPHFALAHELGVKITMHAGESQDSSFVRYAVEHGALRVGHGIHAYGDDEVLQMVKDHNLIFEVSPTSNVLSKCVPSIEEHPIKKLYDMGILINVNTDDPGLMGITLNSEYDLLKEKFGFTDSDFIKMNLVSAKASFCEGKEEIIKELENLL